MKSIFEEMGGTYRKKGDYLIPNLSLPDMESYQIGKYGRMYRGYLKENHHILYANLLTSYMLHKHLAKIDSTCQNAWKLFARGWNWLRNTVFLTGRADFLNASSPAFNKASQIENIGNIGIKRTGSVFSH